MTPIKTMYYRGCEIHIYDQQSSLQFMAYKFNSSGEILRGSFIFSKYFIDEHETKDVLKVLKCNIDSTIDRLGIDAI